MTLSLFIVMQMKINLPFFFCFLVFHLKAANLIYVHSHRCAENFPLNVAIEEIHGTANLTNFKLQLFMSKNLDFCNKNQFQKQIKSDRLDTLPAMVYNSNKCYKQLMQAQLSQVKVVIMTKMDWSSYKDQNAGILSKLSSLLVVEVSSSDMFNIQKYAEKCDKLHGELFYDKAQSYSILQNVHLPHLYFNIQYKNGFNLFREFYLNHLFQAFYPLMKFRHLLLYTGQNCTNCDPNKDCFDVNLTELKRICYEPNPESYRSGRQIIKEQVRSLLLASRSETRKFWWKYAVLFADNACDQSVDLVACVDHTLAQLGLDKESIGKIEYYTNQFMKWQELDRLREEGQLLKFTKTQKFKHNEYNSRVYEQLIKHCLEADPNLRPQLQCAYLRHLPLKLALTKDKDQLFHEFIQPNFHKDGIVEQQVIITLDSYLGQMVGSELLIVLKNVDMSYTQFIGEREPIRYVGNMLNKQSLLEFQLSYNLSIKTQYKNNNQYPPITETRQETKQINGRSSVYEGDKNRQISTVLIYESNKLYSLKLLLKFNGHQKYILQVHHKNKTQALFSGDKLVHRIGAEVTSYKLVFDDIDNSLFNFFYVECNFRYDPNFIVSLVLFANTTVDIMNSHTSSESKNYQILTIPKKTLLTLWKNKTIPCTTESFITTCNASMRLTFRNKSGNIYSPGTRIVTIRFLKYQSNRIMPYIDQFRNLQLQTTFVQYIDMHSFGQGDKILPSSLLLTKNKSDIRQEFRICSNFSDCDFYTKQNWNDMLEAQTRLLPITYPNGNDQNVRFGFKDPASKLRRDQRVKNVRVFMIYHIKQPQYVDFVTLQRKLSYSNAYYFEPQELVYASSSQFSQIVDSDAVAYNTSNRFLIKHQNNSKNIVYYAFLAVNNYDGNLRVYAKANLNNLSKQLHFQAYNRQEYQGLKRIFSPNLYELKVKIFSSEAQRIYIDVYIEDKAKQMNRTEPNVYSISFTSYKSIDPIRAVRIGKNIKVNVFSELYSNHSKPHFYISNKLLNSNDLSVIITAQPVQTADLAKIYLCYAKMQANQLVQQTCVKEGKVWDFLQNQNFKRQIGYGYRIEPAFSWNASAIYFNIYHEKGSAVQVKVGYQIHHKLRVIQNTNREKELKSQKYYSGEVQRRVDQIDRKKDGKQFKNNVTEQTKTKQEESSRQNSQLKKNNQTKIDQTEIGKVQNLEKSLQARKEKARQEDKDLQMLQNKIQLKRKVIRKELAELQQGEKYVKTQGAEINKKKGEIVALQKQNQVEYLKYLQQKKQIEKVIQARKEKSRQEEKNLEIQSNRNQLKRKEIKKQLAELQQGQKSVKIQNAELKKKQDEIKALEKQNQLQYLKYLHQKNELQKQKKILEDEKVKIKLDAASIQAQKQQNKQKREHTEAQAKQQQARKTQLMQKIAQDKISIQRQQKENQDKNKKMLAMQASAEELSKKVQKKSTLIDAQLKLLEQKLKQNRARSQKLAEKSDILAKQEHQIQVKQQKLKRQRLQLERAHKQNQILREKNRKQTSEAKQQIAKEQTEISQQEQGQILTQEKRVKIKFEIQVQKTSGQNTAQQQSKSTKQPITPQKNQPTNNDQKSLEQIKDTVPGQPNIQKDDKQPSQESNKERSDSNKSQQKGQDINFLQIMFILLLVLFLFLSLMTFLLYKMFRNLKLKAMQPRNNEQTCSRIKEEIKEQQST